MTEEDFSIDNFEVNDVKPNNGCTYLELGCLLSDAASSLSVQTTLQDLIEQMSFLLSYDALSCSWEQEDVENEVFNLIDQLNFHK